MEDPAPPPPRPPGRAPTISTRTGDEGETSLLYGQRVPKDHPQVRAGGALDHLNAALGMARALAIDPRHRESLLLVQHDLVGLMAETACAEEDAARFERSASRRLAGESLVRLDQEAAALEARRPHALTGWAVPGDNPASAALELARTAARAAEREVVALAHTGRHLRPLCLAYLNRLSDLLWLLARDAER